MEDWSFTAKILWSLFWIGMAASVVVRARRETKR